MDYSRAIARHLQESAALKQQIVQTCSPGIERAVVLIAQALRQGHQLLLCGNGGSAADAQHIAAEFVIRLSHHLQRPALPALALTTDSSILTAGANDIGYENIFARQVEAFGRQGDVLLGISTSGNSPNVLKAFELARKNELMTIGLLGNDGGKGRALTDLAIIVPSHNTQYIQEAHITIGHIIVELVEQTLYGASSAL